MLHCHLNSSIFSNFLSKHLLFDTYMNRRLGNQRSIATFDLWCLKSIVDNLMFSRCWSSIAPSINLQMGMLIRDAGTCNSATTGWENFYLILYWYLLPAIILKWNNSLPGKTHLFIAKNYTAIIEKSCLKSETPQIVVIL